MKQFIIETYIHEGTDWAQVEFELYRGQKQILYPNEMAQPYEPPEIIINSIELGGENIMDDISNNDMDRIVDECWMEVVNDQDAYEAAEEDYHAGIREDRKLNGF